MIHHLTSINQTYFEHLSHAWGYSYESFKAGILLLIHGALPTFFVTEGGNCIIDLAKEIDSKRQHLTPPYVAYTQEGVGVTGKSDHNSILVP